MEKQPDEAIKTNITLEDEDQIVVKALERLKDEPLRFTAGQLKTLDKAAKEE